MAGAKKLAPATPGTDIQIAEKTPPAIAAQEVALRQDQETASALFGIPPEATPDELIDMGVRAVNAAGYQMARAGAAFGALAKRFAKTVREIAEESGVSHKHVQNAIQLAEYIESLPEAQARRMLAVPYTKVLAVAKAEPEVVAELLEEGALDGDSPLSVRELYAALRDARADIAAKDARAETREREIERLGRNLASAQGLRERATPEEVTEQLRLRASATALQVRADICAHGPDVDSLHERFAALRAHAVEIGGEGSMGDEQDQFMAGVIGELFTELRRLRDSLALPIVNDHGAPDWMKGL